MQLSAPRYLDERLRNNSLTEYEITPENITMSAAVDADGLKTGNGCTTLIDNICVTCKNCTMVKSEALP